MMIRVQLFPIITWLLYTVNCFNIHGYRQSQILSKYYRQKKVESVAKMSTDDQALMEEMRKTLGERNDVFGDIEASSKQTLLQGLRDISSKDTKQQVTPDYSA